MYTGVTKRAKRDLLIAFLSSFTLIIYVAYMMRSQNTQADRYDIYVYSYKTKLTVITTFDSYISTMDVYETDGTITEYPITGKVFVFIPNESGVGSISIQNKDKTGDVIRIGDRINKERLSKLMYPYILINNQPIKGN